MQNDTMVATLVKNHVNNLKYNMRIHKENTVALIVDIQEKLFPFIDENEKLANNVLKLLKGLKILEIPLIVSEQYKKGLGETIPILKEVLSNSPFFEKITFSCCDNSDIFNNILTANRKNILVCGIESHICVLQTVEDLLEKKYTPIVIADCVSSRNPYDKEIALKRMEKSGAIITTLESILFELTRVAGSEQFKSISKLVK